jgi:hypothetical protein
MGKEPETTRKLGVISIARHSWQPLVSEIDLRKELFKIVTPMNLITENSHYQPDVQKWLCYCESFKEVKEGDMYPEYLVTVTTKNKQIHSIKVEEKK